MQEKQPMHGRKVISKNSLRKEDTAFGTHILSLVISESLSDDYLISKYSELFFRHTSDNFIFFKYLTDAIFSHIKICQIGFRIYLPVLWCGPNTMMNFSDKFCFSVTGTLLEENILHPTIIKSYNFIVNGLPPVYTLARSVVVGTVQQMFHDFLLVCNIFWPTLWG